MIGIIHQLLFDFVRGNWGEEAVQEVRRRAGLDDAVKFRMDQAYPDEQWRKLLASAVELSGLSSDDAELAFAKFAGGELRKRMGGFFHGCNSTREFLERQPTIHNSMASSVRDPQSRKAIADKFRVEQAGPETIVHYVSPNRHCTLYRGLALWVADYFKETVEITEPRCMKRGDPECEIHIRHAGNS